ncbi:MAG: hypothetical protein ACLFNU_08005 [Bacteroidales bacterium]
MQKRILLKFYVAAVLLIFLSIGTVTGQDRSSDDEPKYLIDLTETKLTGFGNTHNDFSFVNGELAYVSGASGAFLFNYRFYIGIYSLSLNSKHMMEDIYPSDHHPDDNPLLPTHINHKLCFNHGGLMVGYIHNPNNLWHLNTNLKIGTGMVALMDKDFDFSDFEQHHRDRVGVITPELDLEINLARWCKFGMSLGYRLVFGVNDDTYTNSMGEQLRLYHKKDLSSPTFAVKFHFGSFGPKGNDSK